MSRWIKRVVIDSRTFSVSRENRDVDNGRIADMAFTLDFGQAGFSEAGITSLPARKTQNKEATVKTILFGHTFKDPPLILMGYTQKNKPSDLIPPKIEGFRTGDVWYLSDVHARVFKGRVEFRNYKLRKDPSVTVRWMVLS